MRDEHTKKTKLSWSKSFVRKWFNIKTRSYEVHADVDVFNKGVNGDRRNSFSERETYAVKKSKTDKSSRRCFQGKVDIDAYEIRETQNYRIFVATWNVGGKSPPSYLNLDGWLHTSPLADIYVLGFQEIVPLNAGNVLGSEDNAPARKWVNLIRNTLNNLPGGSGTHHTPSPVPDPIVDFEADFDESTRQNTASFFHRHSFQSSRSFRRNRDILASQPCVNRRYSVCDQVMFGSRLSDYDLSYRWCASPDDENVGIESQNIADFSTLSNGCSAQLSKYCLIASKKMVGIFLTVWVRGELKDDVRNIKVSCVGRGLMGYLGNKGSISISMQLHQTSFCFVCSHLTSGQKEGDEIRRNSDVMEILKKTRFPRVHNLADERVPETILQHDRVIWLGDLNYRIALPHRTVKALVEMHNWKALLVNDQLRIEQRRGHVFAGWHEGRIYFPPTYKYSNNSDRYAGYEMHPKEKRRTPAWCDRILWYGRGISQLSYVRGESRFSDHRPVYSVFKAEV